MNKPLLVLPPRDGEAQMHNNPKLEQGKGLQNQSRSYTPAMLMLDLASHTSSGNSS